MYIKIFSIWIFVASSLFAQNFSENYGLFYQCVQSGRVEVVERMLEAGIDPVECDKFIEGKNLPGLERPSLLMVAIGNRDVPMLKLLLKHGINPNQVIPLDDSDPLIEAVSSGSLDLVKTLLKFGADPCFITNRFYTPEQVANELGYTDILKILQNHPCNKVLSEHDCNSAIVGSIVDAIKKNDCRLLKYALERRMRRLDCFNSDGKTFLIAASESGNEEAVELLLKHGASIDIKSNDEYQKTALMVAVSYGEKECVERLLDAGASVSKTSADGSTALLYAYDSPDICNLLLKYGAEINHLDNDGYNVFLSVLANGHMDFAFHLLQLGADLCAITKNQVTAVELALSALTKEKYKTADKLIVLMKKRNCRWITDEGICRIVSQGSVEDLEYLYKKGISLNVHDKFGRSLLMLASSDCYNTDFVRFLLKKGVSVNEQVKQGLFKGSTALHFALSFSRNPGIVEILTKAGADWSLRDVYSISPKDLRKKLQGYSSTQGNFSSTHPKAPDNSGDTE